MKTDNSTTIRRVGAGAIAVAGIGVAIVLMARCSAPSTITPPVDVTADLNAAGAAINALAAWEPHSDPRFVRIGHSGANPDARVVTATLGDTGELVEIAVVPDEDGNWSAQGHPHPVAGDSAAVVRALAERPPQPPTDPWLAASEFLAAWLTGDSTEARAWASGDYRPVPLDSPYESVEITATDDAVTFPAAQLGFIPIDYTTADDDGLRRHWRSWVAVRENQGRWFVEGMYAVEPVPRPEEPS